MTMPPRSSTRKRYNFSFKLEAVKLAKESSNRKTVAEDLGVPYSALRRWIKEEDVYLALVSKRAKYLLSRHRVDGSGRPCFIKKDLEEHLIKYIDAQREEHFKVTIGMVLRELKIRLPEWKPLPRPTLRRRLWRMLRRREITLRRVTHQAQHTRKNEEEIRKFRESVIKELTEHNIPFNNIANFDETNIFFAPDSKVTLNRRGERTINVKKANQTQRCSVMLGCSFDGHKFPPFLVFIGQDTMRGTIASTFRKIDALPESEKGEGKFYDGYPLDNFYRVQKKGWMSSTLMLDWVDKVWKPWVDKQTGRTALILDKFGGHNTDAVIEKIKSVGTHVIFIPGGYTSKLQVMDVGLNKPFKDVTNDEYDEWFHENCPKKPTRQVVSGWVVAGWKAIRKDTIYKTWRRVLGPEYPGFPATTEATEITTTNDSSDDTTNGVARLPVQSNESDDGEETITIESLSDEDSDLESLTADLFNDNNKKKRGKKQSGKAKNGDESDSNIDLDDDDELDVLRASLVVTKKSHNLRSELWKEKRNNNKNNKKGDESVVTFEDKNDEEYVSPEKKTPNSERSDRSLRSGDTVLRSNRRLFNNFEVSPEQKFY
jgi:DDE superfamily endonuclease/Transposase